MTMHNQNRHIHFSGGTCGMEKRIKHGGTECCEVFAFDSNASDESTSSSEQ